MTVCPAHYSLMAFPISASVSASTLFIASSKKGIEFGVNWLRRIARETMNSCCFCPCERGINDNGVVRKREIVEALPRTCEHPHLSLLSEVLGSVSGELPAKAAVSHQVVSKRKPGKTLTKEQESPLAKMVYHDQSKPRVVNA
jgi:hypothetical protein